MSANFSDISSVNTDISRTQSDSTACLSFNLSDDEKKDFANNYELMQLFGDFYNCVCSVNDDKNLFFDDILFFSAAAIIEDNKYESENKTFVDTYFNRKQISCDPIHNPRIGPIQDYETLENSWDQKINISKLTLNIYDKFVQPYFGVYTFFYLPWNTTQEEVFNIHNKIRRNILDMFAEANKICPINRARSIAFIPDEHFSTFHSNFNFNTNKSDTYKYNTTVSYETNYKLLFRFQFIEKENEMKCLKLMYYIQTDNETRAEILNYLLEYTNFNTIKNFTRFRDAYISHSKYFLRTYLDSIQFYDFFSCNNQLRSDLIF